MKEEMKTASLGVAEARSSPKNEVTAPLPCAAASLPASRLLLGSLDFYPSPPPRHLYFSVFILPSQYHMDLEKRATSRWPHGDENRNSLFEYVFRVGR